MWIYHLQHCRTFHIHTLLGNVKATFSNFRKIEKNFVGCFAQNLQEQLAFSEIVNYYYSIIIYLWALQDPIAGQLGFRNIAKPAGSQDKWACYSHQVTWTHGLGHRDIFRGLGARLRPHIQWYSVHNYHLILKKPHQSVFWRSRGKNVTALRRHKNRQLFDIIF